MDSKDFIDYAGFYLALSAVDEILMSSPENLPAGIDMAQLQAHQVKGRALVKVVAEAMDDGIKVLLTEMAEKGRIRAKTVLDRATMGNPVTGYTKRADALKTVLVKLIPHQAAARDVLGTAANKGLPLMKAASADAPTIRVLNAASIPTANPQNARIKKWSMVASGLCGNPISDEDQIANDILEAKAIATEAARTQALIDAADPGDAKLEELSAKKARLNRAQKKAIEESKNPKAVQTTTSQQKAEDSQKTAQTIVGQKIEGGITPEQEECVMARGKLVIAAGAGSGKTRVLAAKVIHHMQELGHSADSVLAVSFSIKSAGELRDRVRNFGNQAGLDMSGLGGEDGKGKISEEYRGFGTTHSIARMVLNASGRYRISGDPKAAKQVRAITGGDQNSLIRAAIAQVKMKSKGTAAPMPRDAMSFFPNLGKGDFSYMNSLSAVKQPIVSPTQTASPLSYYLGDASRFAKLLDVTTKAMSDALNSLRMSRRELNTKYGDMTKVFVSGPGIEQFATQLEGFTFNRARGRFEPAKPEYNSPDQYVWWVNGFGIDVGKFKSDLYAATGLDKVQNAIAAVSSMSRDPKKLTAEQREILETVVTQPIVSTALAANGLSGKTAADLADIEERMDNSEASNEKSDLFYWFNNPADQWFNLGVSDDAFMESSGKGKKKISIASVKRFISMNKNNLRAPGDLFNKASKSSGASMMGYDTDETLETGEGGVSPNILAAVYGAYEWIKANDASTRGRLDFDDQLVQAARVLTESPQLLRRLQMKYKCILVDEAQDLNAVQHHLFGLIAGYTDPRTLTPRTGKMTADTFAFIGDDKQAIYEFRGAEPDQFIYKSDAFERENPVTGKKEKGDFKTLLLDKNFRSGKEIVDAANRLIAYNEKQIPMQCTTNPKKGEGSILREQVRFAEEGPSVMVNRILSDLKEIQDSGDPMPENFYKRYGLAARTNREIVKYQFALIAAGIPFRSKRNPFEGPALKPIVSLFRMFLPGTTVDIRNKGFLDGVKAPDRGVNPNTLNDRLTKENAGDYYDFCKSGGYKKIYSQRAKDQFKGLEEYSTVFLPELEKLVQKGSSKEVLEFITNSKGIGGQTFIDQLAVAVRLDAEAMEEAEELAASEEGDGTGEVTDDTLRQVASKPLEPLKSLANKYPKAKDFIGYLNTLANKSVEVNKTDADAKSTDSLVTIDTVHGWKGLECENLFVPMYEGAFPIIRASTPEDQKRAMESERRLAYVALTRGESSVTIIEATEKVVETDKGPKIVRLDPSPFVEEACIKVKGSGNVQPTPKGKSASMTLDFSDFLMPLYNHREVRASDIDHDIEAQWGETMMDYSGDDLEAQWGETIESSYAVEVK